MRAAISLLVASVALGVWAPPSFAQGDDAVAQAVAKSDAAIRKLVEALGSADFRMRDQATRDLTKLDEVPDALRAAAKSGNLELRRRAEAIARTITDRLLERAYKAMAANQFDIDRFLRIVKDEKLRAKYGINDKETAAAERERWHADKERYAKEHPLRAAIFEAAAQLESLRTLKTPMTLQSVALPKELFDKGRVKDPQWEYCPGGYLVGVSAWLYLHLNSPGSKANAELLVALIKEQEPSAKAIFELEQVLQQMREAAKEREKEKSKRWQADFDFALARVETNLVLLFEYNYLLGQVRADGLPDLGKEDDGWMIVSVPKITIPETKAKKLAKYRFKRLREIQNDHPDTPWAYFAERESWRELGMQWVARKK